MNNKFVKTSLPMLRDKMPNTFLLLVLCIVLVLIPCLLITSYANHLISEKIRFSNKNFLYAASASIDSSISAAVEQAATIIEANSSDYYHLLHAESMSGSDATLSSYHLNNALHNSSFVSNYFDTVILYFKNPGIILTTSGSYDAETFFSKKYVFADYPTDYFDTLMDTNFKSILCPPTSILTYNVHGEKTIFSSSAIPLAIHPVSSSATDALFILLMDETKLNNTLSYFNPNESCYFYLMDAVSGNILNHSADKDYASLLSLAKQKYSGTSESMMINSCRVYWRTSSVNKLRYICVEPQLLITRQLQVFFALTFFITLITILLLIFCHKRFALWLQNSISLIHRQLTVASGIETFPSSPKVIDIASLKEAVNLLCIQYENNRPHLITSFLIRLLQNNVTEEEVQDFCRQFAIFKPQDYFNIIIIRTNFNPYGDSPLTAAEISSTLSHLHKLLSEYGYIVSSHNSKDCLLFLTAPSLHELETIRRHFIDSLANLVMLLPEFICGIGIDYHNIYDTYRCYHQVLTLLEQHGIATEKFFYTMEDLLSTCECRLSPKEKEKIITLSRHTPEECLLFITNLLFSWKSQNAGLYQYKNAILELLYLFQQLSYELNIPFSAVFYDRDENLTASVSHQLTPQRLNNLCLDSYKRLIDIIQNRNTNVSRAENTLLLYIDEHLADINLTMLSEVTGMNQNYLSQYFKKHFGITFLDYTTRKKIDRAKNLLVNSSLTCKSIGESLGYHDPNVFIRTFKKLEAVTPNEYRRIHRKHT